MLKRHMGFEHLTPFNIAIDWAFNAFIVSMQEAQFIETTNHTSQLRHQ
jgi:hypothetical protein